MAQPSLKIDMEGKGPDGFGWRSHFEYDKLGAYAVDIAQTGESFASRISGFAGTAASTDPAYIVTFKVTGPDLPEQFKRGKEHIEAQATGLQYSEMTLLQDEGLELLKQLNQAAHNEIKAGQRK